MGIAAWIGLGLVAGFLASLLVNKHGGGMLIDIVLGVVGLWSADSLRILPDSKASAVLTSIVC
jgi:uncharacterized membrane protein YeaQ/YmgE (transglycosylase-associated protein family)